MPIKIQKKGFKPVLETLLLIQPIQAAILTNKLHLRIQLKLVYFEAGNNSNPNPTE